MQHITQPHITSEQLSGNGPPKTLLLPFHLLGSFSFLIFLLDETPAQGRGNKTGNLEKWEELKQRIQVERQSVTDDCLQP